MKIEINIDDALIRRVQVFFSRRRIITACIILCVMSVVIIKASTSGLTVFQANTTIKASEVNDNFSNLQTQINTNTPAGAVTAYAGQTVPDGWLLCDGSAVDRTTYSALFTAIGTSWGTGDGSSTFNLPDLRGRFLRGVDSSAGNDPSPTSRYALNGGNSGNAVGSYQRDAFQGHWHNSLTGSSAINVYCDVVYGYPNNNISNNTNVKNPINDGTNGDPLTAKETRPKNAYVYFIIKSR